MADSGQEWQEHCDTSPSLPLGLPLLLPVRKQSQFSAHLQNKYLVRKVIVCWSLYDPHPHPTTLVCLCICLYLTIRQDICHMHHMQRMCKIISSWVKLYILKVLFEQFM